MSRTVSDIQPSADDQPATMDRTMSDTATEKPTKKAKAERAPKPPKIVAPGAPSKTSREQRKKRGPARPHRRLDTETINLRITKLEKRRLRAKEQLEDATRHVEGYQAEREFREQEAVTAAGQESSM
jgi:hypothetical protein